MLNVGIINPNWTVQRYNTDHVCVMDFAGMQPHAPGLKLDFVGSPRQYLLANLNRVSQRLAGCRVFPSIHLAPSDAFQALYRYGNDVQGLTLKGKGHAPLLSTIGYPSLNKELALGNRYMQGRARQLEIANQDSQLLHFHTDVMRELYVDHLPHEASRCVSAPFYLPHLQCISEDELSRKFDQPETLLLFVGSDGIRKGLGELCTALDDIATDPAARHLKVVVVSRHTPNCQRFAAIRHERSLPRDQVQTLMRQAHIYCMVPSHESFGLVFVEAMASGCAVICDDDLPRQEILDHGRCGTLVPSQRPDQISSAIKSMLADRKAMQHLAAMGLKRARERYVPEHVAGTYSRIFHAMTN